MLTIRLPSSRAELDKITASGSPASAAVAARKPFGRAFMSGHAEVRPVRREQPQGHCRLRECAAMAFLGRLLLPRLAWAQGIGAAEAEVVALPFGSVLDPEKPWGLSLVALEAERVRPA
jgi:hypothetical protein